MSLRFPLTFLLLYLLCACNQNTEQQALEETDYPSPFLLAGEPTANSILLQARFNASDTLVDGDVPGQTGFIRFELSSDPDFAESTYSDLLTAGGQRDYIVKWLATDLQINTRYYYRVEFGNNDVSPVRSAVHTFKTLPGPGASDSVKFVMVTGSHYERFYHGRNMGKPDKENWRRNPLSAEDSVKGFPGLATITQLEPLFYIGNGDNVYYDHGPTKQYARTEAEMRAKWHRQFLMPRYGELFAKTATYWLKDDHDYRFDDADTVAENKKHGSLPSHEMGMEIFKEQLPIIPFDRLDEARTYRTYRINTDLQIWLLENRDYRSPNNYEDGPEKSIWGEEQKAWLKETLQNSTAAYKLLISPTPMVGPDDKRKTDNHTNIGGFQYEANEFYDWLKANEFGTDELLILCGDRHWQYHTVHPSGYQEFSCGALVDENSRMGRKPGDPGSTDPEGTIEVKFMSPEATGGFMMVEVFREGETPVLHIIMYDEQGSELYRHEQKLAS